MLKLDKSTQKRIQKHFISQADLSRSKLDEVKRLFNSDCVINSVLRNQFFGLFTVVFGLKCSELSVLKYIVDKCSVTTDMGGGHNLTQGPPMFVLSSSQIAAELGLRAQAVQVAIEKLNSRKIITLDGKDYKDTVVEASPGVYFKKRCGHVYSIKMTTSFLRLVCFFKVAGKFPEDYQGYFEVDKIFHIRNLRRNLRENSKKAISKIKQAVLKKGAQKPKYEDVPITEGLTSKKTRVLKDRELSIYANIARSMMDSQKSKSQVLKQLATTLISRSEAGSRNEAMQIIINQILPRMALE